MYGINDSFIDRDKRIVSKLHECNYFFFEIFEISLLNVTMITLFPFRIPLNKEKREYFAQD